MADLLSRGDVNSRRKGVIGRLSHVYVVVWVHRVFASQHSSEHLYRAVSDYFLEVFGGCDRIVDEMPNSYYTIHRVSVGYAGAGRGWRGGG